MQIADAPMTLTCVPMYLIHAKSSREVREVRVLTFQEYSDTRRNAVRYVSAVNQSLVHHW